MVVGGLIIEFKIVSVLPYTCDWVAGRNVRANHAWHPQAQSLLIFRISSNIDIGGWLQTEKRI